jgi:hypothetical protein
MLENVKSRRLLSHAASGMSAVSSVFSSFISNQDKVMSDILDDQISGGFLFAEEKAKSIRPSIYANI